MTQTANPHEERARALKATKLYEALGVESYASMGQTPEEIILALSTDKNLRWFTAKKAGVHEPSQATWRAVARLIEEHYPSRYAGRRECVWCGIAYPLDRFDGSDWCIDCERQAEREADPDEEPPF